MRGSGRRVVAMLATGAVALAAAPSAAQAGAANGGLPGAGPNPIAHMAWAAPRNDGPWSAYESATGANRTLLGKLAAQPRAVWLGWWCSVGSVRAQAAQTVALAQNGNPNVLTEFATYELYPWAIMQPNGFDQPDLNGSWNVRADETWYRNMAAGIGSARALVVEQIDLPFARRMKSTAPEQVNTYAARVLSANPHTTVYIDSGTYTWLSPAQAATLLIRNGIRYARGFSLNDTGYESTTQEDVYGAQIVAALAKQGVKGKHFIVDTVENGQPYMPRNVGQGERAQRHAQVPRGGQDTLPAPRDPADHQRRLATVGSERRCLEGRQALLRWLRLVGAAMGHRWRSVPQEVCAVARCEQQISPDHAADENEQPTTTQTTTTQTTTTQPTTTQTTNAADDNAADDNADDHPADGDRPVAITSRRGCPSISVAPCQS